MVIMTFKALFWVCAFTINSMILRGWYCCVSHFADGEPEALASGVFSVELCPSKTRHAAVLTLPQNDLFGRRVAADVIS